MKNIPGKVLREKIPGGKPAGFAIDLPNYICKPNLTKLYLYNSSFFTIVKKALNGLQDIAIRKASI